MMMPSTTDKGNHHTNSDTLCSIESNLTMHLPRFDRERHIAYFAACVRQLPMAYCKLDTNRLTLVHFSVHALDLLSVWENEDLCLRYGLHKASIIEWIYSLQVVSRGFNGNNSNHHHHNNNNHIHENNDVGEDSIQSSSPSPKQPPPPPPQAPSHSQHTRVGFLGGSFLGPSWDVSQDHESLETDTTTAATSAAMVVGDDGNRDAVVDECHPPPHMGHIAMTYTALCTLRALGDDGSRIDRRGILSALPHLQLPNGSFQSTGTGSEHDMRFLYCACCICYLLQDWSGIDIDRAVEYIRSCRSWDGAIALLPGGEGHGGSTFTAIASLVLMNRLDEVFRMEPDWEAALIHWCVHRQMGGMQGRPHKDEDTCYSYWIGGTLRLLRQDHLLHHPRLQYFVLRCQHPIMGGFSKVLHTYPDVLHAFYSMAYLSLSQHQQEVEEQEQMQGEDTKYVFSSTAGMITTSSQSPSLIRQVEDGMPMQLKELNCTLGICRDRTRDLVPELP